MDSLRDAVPFLRRPFTPEAIRFKVQSVFKGASGCLVVAYIDARLVIERLNLVVPDLWRAGYTLSESKPNLLWCQLEIDRVMRQDVGESPKGMSKDLVSDALKRAAVHFGVGVSVYALPQITLYAKQSALLEKRETAKGATLVLTEKGHEKLRDGYRQWLARDHGFGEPLDHGDVEGETLDPEVEVDEFVPEPAPALGDERAKKLTAAARSAYDRLVAVKGGAGLRAVPPGVFGGWLAGAAHSHEELERLVAHLEQRREEIAGEES